MAKVLIVESDKLISDNLKRYLKRAGYQVDWQCDLQTALDAADVNRPDIVVLDLMLCGRSGIEFLYEFRSYPDWQDVPVVLFSNVSRRDLGGTAPGLDELNISAYHYKPTTSLSQLAQSIDFILRSPANAQAGSN